ncbi:Tn3 family transposase [Microbispora siamensis]|uniref:Tn3 transposase DDE domain-containing protein n=1 Tax=Microbispora siamensis TaxID=564413 RepID=A0ABQ4GKG3_9ACTN|nr:Tn3 family transposase [Microbispora siamensis]GIH61855.1 hypothetical protein Msi02_26720 [Microbispora siamensis]
MLIANRLINLARRASDRGRLARLPQSETGGPHSWRRCRILQNLDGGVKPEMVATDNASYSDMAFGLYKMPGFRFASRFRELDDQRS